MIPQSKFYSKYVRFVFLLRDVFVLNRNPMYIYVHIYTCKLTLKEINLKLYRGKFILGNDFLFMFGKCSFICY